MVGLIDPSWVVLILRELSWDIKSFEKPYAQQSFQKSVYLLQILGLLSGYRFRWYGKVYSEGLSDDCYEFFWAQNHYKKKFEGDSFNKQTKKDVFGKFQELFGNYTTGDSIYLKETAAWLELVTSACFVAETRNLNDAAKIRNELFDLSPKYKKMGEEVEKAINLTLEHLVNI